MCNLYSMTKARSEAVRLSRALTDRNNNQPPLPGVYPDYAAPIVIRGEGGQREMRDARWGLPSSKKALLDAATKRAEKLRAKGQEVDFARLCEMEPDGGTTNLRNTASKHWLRWLEPQHRCLVPFTSFCEPDQVGGSKQPIWFALHEERPLAFFAGVWVRDWTCVRKMKEGQVTCDLFGFLTTDANDDVGAYHSKAMPVILTTEEECELWLSDATWARCRSCNGRCPAALSRSSRAARGRMGRPPSWSVRSAVQRQALARRYGRGKKGCARLRLISPRAAILELAIRELGLPKGATDKAGDRRGGAALERAYFQAERLKQGPFGCSKCSS